VILIFVKSGDFTETYSHKRNDYLHWGTGLHKTYYLVRDEIWEAGRDTAKKYPPFFMEPVGSLNVLTENRHWILSPASRTQFVPFILSSQTCILILRSHVRLCLPSGLFPSGLTTKTLETPFPMHATCPAHLNLLVIALTICREENRLWSSSLCNILHHLSDSL
jgi:hypothetical protein